MTVQSSIILRLIDQIPDEDLRRQITAQYYQDVEAQTNFVQNRIGHLELDLRDMLQQQLGVTNEMIGEAVASSRDNGKQVEAVVTELRAGRAEQELLRRTAEQGFLSAEQRFATLDASLEDISSEFGTFRVSVDERFDAQGQLWSERRNHVDNELLLLRDQIAQLEADRDNTRQELLTLRDLLMHERGA